ncbi:hypothetical protein [Phycisphaera mikurensis]|uniref:Secreted protein n=1 Tax=Phycisphaera mikurensis (strain NBRC 102666 / KCTC 22515 / FYK2301M01) TaxID=1142394 RepID=I0IF21_PHYMF|nr:hypothetical protein [Phycisphaera mikurensis]MBB6441650.1 hypothetical protein [Phycisphaera mikurensis]BAM03859.1 hypothetical protein PSMK_17000 [Phycisphaera mikurensis NBRC 102666]
MRLALLCLLLALPAAAAPPELLLRTPPWELREGDAAAALGPTLERVRAADRAAVDAWVERPEGEGPLGPRALDEAAEALELTGFAHPADPLADRPDPDLEPLRTLGRLLAAEGVRRGREAGWSAATPPLRAAVRLGHRLGEAQGLTRVLVGLAVQQRVVQALEALAEEPGLPHLHATLADLTHQRIDVLPAAWTQLARPALNDPLIQQARDAVDAPGELANADWDELLHRLVLALAVGFEPDPEKPDEPLPPLPPAAEAALAAFGPAFEAVAPPGVQPRARRLIEGVLAEWDRLRGEAWADTLVPYHVLRAQPPRVPGPGLPERLLLPLIASPLPALAAAADLDRRMAALQGAEALREHAARAGRFPETLAEVDPPVPDDPFTGGPPGYAVSADGRSATLRQEPLPGDAPGRAHTHRVEVQAD